MIKVAQECLLYALVAPPSLALMIIDIVFITGMLEKALARLTKV